MVDTIRLGVAPLGDAAAARARVRAALGVSDAGVLFSMFGKITAETRIDAILRAFERLARERPGVHLLVAGDTSDCPALGERLATAACAARTHDTGYVPAEQVAGSLAASDACLCLRWPTALESSASWLQCLAAGRPTAISGLAHLADIPTIDARDWRPSHGAAAPVAISIDLLAEDDALMAAMQRLADDREWREQLGHAGHAYWSEAHTLEATVADYERVIAHAASQPAPTVADLPAHFTADHSTKAREITERFGMTFNEVLGSTF